MKNINLEQGGSEFLAVSDAGTVTIADSALLLNAEYARDGSDLKLTGPDGTEFVVSGYFNLASPPTLISSDGQALSGETIALLAGPQAPAQYAQVTGGQFGEPIGQVETLSGTASAQRPSGLTVELEVGAPVFKGDVVSAGDGATVGITFLDKTVFTISDGATMVLNEMVYNPEGSSNSMLFNLIGGTAAFVAGAVAKSGEMKVETPVAVMAIRGTTPFATCQGGPEGCVFGGEEGEYVLLHKIAGKILATIGDPSVVVQLQGVNADPVVSSPNADLQAVMQKVFGALRETVSILEQRAESGEALINGPGTGSPQFAAEGFIESIAGFFKSSFTRLLNEAQIAPEDTEVTGQIEQLDPQPILSDSTTEDESVVIEVINEQDVLNLGQNSVIIGAIVTSGQGSAQVGADGKSVIYDPGSAYDDLSKGDSAAVQISILVDQGNGQTANETISVTVLGVNDDPTANDDQAAVGENSIVDIKVLANDTDPDANDSLNVASANVTAGMGVATVAPGSKSILYDPGSAYEHLAAGDTANVEITYTISDGNGGTDSAKAFVTVKGVNDDPVANADQAQVAEGGSVVVDVLANDTDVDATDQLSVVSASVPAGQGSAGVSADGLSVVYDPGSNFEGLGVGDTATVVVTYGIADGNGGTSTSTVRITVEGTNDGPAARADQAGTGENSAVRIHALANDTDPDGSDALVITGAAISDGLGNVRVATDGQSLVYDPGNAYDSLAVGETAMVKISYDISDGNGGTDSATAVVTVSGVNDEPNARNDSATTDEDSTVRIGVLANDSDPDGSDVLTVSAASISSGLGSVKVSADGNSVVYDPGTDYNFLALGETATVKIKYTVSDGNGGTDVATVSVAVTGGNDAPTALADAASTGETRATTIDVLANDSDPDTSDVLTVTNAVIISGLGTAGVSADGLAVEYDPGTAYNDLAAGETALVKIRYTISDGNGGTDTAIATVTVRGTNDGPVARPDTASVGEDSTVVIPVLNNDSDADASDELVVTNATVIDGLGSAAVSANGLSVVYDPGGAYNSLAVEETATVKIRYTISDGNGGTDTAVATVTVNGSNDAPTALADAAGTGETRATTIDVLANDSDPDTSDVLTVINAVIISGLGTAGVSADGLAVEYDPGTAYNDLAAGETALVKIRYTISDGNGGTDTAIATVTVRGTNDGPVARPDTASVGEDSTVVIPVLNNDSDADASDELVVTNATVIDGLGSAAVSADGLSVVYDPGSAYNSLAVEETATVKIRYTISDGNGGTDTAVATVTVNGSNDAPTALADAAGTDEDNSVNIAVLANDTDPDTSDKLAVTDASVTSGLGTATTSADGLSVVYDPGSAYNHLAVGETAIVKINYTIADGNGGTDAAVITVTVHGVNDKPTANDDLGETDEETSVVIDLVGNDTDPDSNDVLKVVAVSVPAGMGSVSIGEDQQSVVFDPAGDFEFLPEGETTTVDISYTVSDGNGGTDTATATVTVTGVNDAAIITGQKTGEVTERDEVDTAEGTLFVNDVDQGESEFLASTQTGIYGTLALTAAGLWVYTLDNTDEDTIALSFEDSETDIFTISSLDGTTDQIVITVKGAGFDFEYNDFGGNSGSSEFKSIDSGTIETSQINLIITPMPLLIDGVPNKVNATQTDLGIGTGQTISAEEGIRMEIVAGVNDADQNDIDMVSFDTHIAVQVFKAGLVQVQGDSSQTATVQLRLVNADEDSDFDTQADAGDIVVPITAGDVTITKAFGNSVVAETFTLGDTVIIAGLQQGDILTVDSSLVFNRVEIENGSDEIHPVTGLPFGGNDFEVGVLGFNMPDELLLVGDANDNTLTGQATNDTLDGRGGKDMLIGGDGVDVFVLGQDLSTGSLADILVDYQEGVDVVDVTELFDLAPGDFTEAGIQEFVRYISSADNDADDPAGAVGDVFIDADGAANGENFVLAAHIDTAPTSVIFRADDGNVLDYVTVV